jgi:hypothetical protein
MPFGQVVSVPAMVVNVLAERAADVDALVVPPLNLRTEGFRNLRHHFELSIQVDMDSDDDLWLKVKS